MMESDEMSKLVWTGARASDIKYTGNFFDGSITLYGNGEVNNKSFCLNKDYRINHNHITDEQTEFMVTNELKMIEADGAIQFMAYNPNLVYDYRKEIRDHMVCLNDQELMRFLDSKIFFREFASKFVPVLCSELFYGYECNIEKLKSKFLNSSAWIIQADIASGGYQTFWVTENNAEQILTKLEQKNQYLVSPYYKENIPINIHAVIYRDEVLVTPGSVQIERLDRNRLLYRGADYIAYKDIDFHIRKQFVSDVEILCREIQKKGYRGLIGIDAMIIDGVARILEVNNRFQASTLLINKVLEEQSLPSLHELNYEAFNYPQSCVAKKEQIQEIEINYSIYAFINEEIMVHSYNILKGYSHEKTVVEYIDDGYVMEQEAEEDAYLFKLIFNTNLVSIVDDKLVRLHPNIVSPSALWYSEIKNQFDIKKLKISLLNQGVVLEEPVIEYLRQNGGMREGVYHSVDLVLDDKYIVNSPLSVKFAALSPFRIVKENDLLFLTYYGNKLCKTRIEFVDKIAKLKTKRGIPIERMCLLATDRLRIQNSDFCTFKEGNIPCRFCEARYRDICFDIEDIKEAVELYFKIEKKAFRHVLIGGLSNDIGKEKNNICEIIKCIREYSDMPIYLMCLPSVCEKDIEEYVELGVTEIGFNLEVFDRQRAAIYMPGKGKIPLERYHLALKKAVSLLGKGGAVRSAFIVGLEPMESLLSGVEYVCKLGVAPIFSVFRPIPFTDMENLNPPENEWLLEAYDKAENICKKYGLKMGPDCSACQNNTLAFDMI